MLHGKPTNCSLSMKSMQQIEQVELAEGDGSEADVGSSDLRRGSEKISLSSSDSALSEFVYSW